MKGLFSSRVVRVLLIALVVVAWIVSGVLLRDPPQTPERTEPGPISVAVEWREAQPVERLLVLQGRVEPDQLVIVRAETAGQVEEWFVRRGRAVTEGEEIARLSLDEREARRRQALARVRDRQSEYEAIRELVEEGFAAPREEMVALAELEDARAALQEIEQEIAHTRLQAPIDGILNRRIAEVGEFVPVGGDVGEIVDNDPLRVVGQVPQHQIARVRTGLIGQIRFINGTTAEGEIIYISPLAEPGTRTFRIEVEVPNPDKTLPSGISAELIIPTETVLAHKVSPALLTLDDEGRVGAMSVDEDDRAEFHRVEVVQAEPDGVWVTGLPDRVRLITIGQGFVTAGERVSPRDETGEKRLGGAP